MKKIKYCFFTLLFIVFSTISLDTATMSNAQAQSGSNYATITYTCVSGKMVDRCWYGSGGCCIHCQALCPGEVW